MNQNLTMVVGDLHLSDGPIDAYRWRTLEWVAGRIADLGVGRLVLLGDVADEKDRHPGDLVNRFVGWLADVASRGVRIVVLMGNHDYRDPGRPFFRFLSYVDRRICFVTQPVSDGGDLFLPHSRDPVSEWERFAAGADGHRVVFCHQTFRGACFGDVVMACGINPDFFGRGVSVFAGDVHRPQQIGPVTYVGTPHPVAFDEDHEPRVLVLERSRLAGLTVRSIPVPGIRRRIVALDYASSDWLGPLSWLRSGDQFRVRLSIPRGLVSEWGDAEAKLQRCAARAGAVLASVDLKIEEAPERTGVVESGGVAGTFDRFCDERGVGGVMRDVGRDYADDGS